MTEWQLGKGVTEYTGAEEVSPMDMGRREAEPSYDISPISGYRPDARVKTTDLLIDRDVSMHGNGMFGCGDIAIGAKADPKITLIDEGNIEGVITKSSTNKELKITNQFTKLGALTYVGNTVQDRSAGGATYGTTYIDRNTQVTEAGTLTSFQFILEDKNETRTFNLKIKVFRDDGSNWVYVGGETFVVTHDDPPTTQTKTLGTPISVQVGDYIAFWHDFPLPETMYPNIEHDNSGGASSSKSGDITSTTAKNTWTTNAIIFSLKGTVTPASTTPTYTILRAYNSSTPGVGGNIEIGDSTNNDSAITLHGDTVTLGNASYPVSTTANQLLYSSAANTIAGLTSANSSVLVTNGSGVPSLATDIPTAVTIGAKYVYRVDGTDVAIADGGTGQSTATLGFNALSPVTTLGDLIYRGATNNDRLAGNTTTTKKFLAQTGNGSISAIPAWDTLIAADIPDLSSTYSITSHNHSGVYEPADSTILKDADIGVTVLAYRTFGTMADETAANYVTLTGGETLTNKVSYNGVALSGSDNGFAVTGGNSDIGQRVGINFSKVGTTNWTAVFKVVGQYTYTFPSATGTLALTSELSSYVTLTGAEVITNKTSYNGVVLTGADYTMSLASGDTGLGRKVTAIFNKSGEQNYQATFTLVGDYVYTLPASTGTIALTSDLSAYQPLDSDLTTIAGLTATTDNFIVSVASAWASRTPAEVKTTLSLNNVENTALSTWVGTTNITTIGAVTATSVNKVTITAPATSATLTLITGSSLITAGAYALTLTSTNTTNVTFPAGTNTLAANNQTFYIGTTQVAINRGSGALTLAGLTLTTPDIGTPSAGVLTNCTGLPSYAGLSATGGMDSYVSLLLHFNGNNGSTAVIDETGKAVTCVGNASISNAQRKFGSSLILDGNGDYLDIASHADLNMGTGNWTIDCWIYPTDNALNYPTIISCVTGWTTNSCGFRWDNGNTKKFSFFWNPSDPFFQSTNTFAAGAWYHVALIRNGNTVKLYVNGVEEASGACDGARTIDWGYGGCRIGYSTWDGVNGYLTASIAEMRVSKGIARWTAAFTPPTRPYGWI